LHEKEGAVLDVNKYLPVFSMGGAYWLYWHCLCSLEKQNNQTEKVFLTTNISILWRTIMKKLFFILMIMCFIPVFSFADEIDDGLPPDTPVKVKESARQAISLGVQNQGMINMTKTMLENRYTEKQMLAVHETLMKAQKQNFDTEPVMNRFNEGVAKREKASDNIKAMEKVRSNYEIAGGLAGKMTQDKTQVKAMMQKMAECMNAGMTTRNMEQISTMLQEKIKAMDTGSGLAFNNTALNAIKQMAKSGADSGSVTKVMKNSFEKGYTVQDMEKLKNVFAAQVKNASSATKLANSFANAIKSGAKADDVGNDAQKSTGSGFGQKESGSGFGSGGPGSSGMGGSGTGSGGGSRGRR
jgi:hypothetical protein